MSGMIDSAEGRNLKSKSVALRVAVAAATFVASAGVGAASFDRGPVYPDRWDPRVAKIAAFVERHRGLTFEHPVRVYFLSPQRYTEISNGGEPELSADDRADERQYSLDNAAELRALGLLEGEPDLNEAQQTLADAGTLAFYSPVDDVVNVRGTKMTVGLRVTLAHELTHALQDQHFDLDALGEADSADAAGAARSVIEGDAVSTENAYIDALDDNEAAEYFDEADASIAESEDQLGEVPDVLETVFGSYYAIGEAFVAFQQATSGGDPRPRNIDPVLRRPPRGSSELLEPITYPARPAPPLSAPRASGEAFESSTFGASFLFVMLSERIDPVVALNATDGWVADAYVASRDDSADGVMCVSAKIRVATSDDGVELSQALRSWSDELPDESDVTVNETGSGSSPKLVTFASCDPGPDVKGGASGHSADALAYPVVRLQVAAGAVSDGSDRRQAFCVGHEVVTHLSLADLQAQESNPTIERAFEKAYSTCG